MTSKTMIAAIAATFALCLSGLIAAFVGLLALGDGGRLSRRLNG
jgi:hypothetical protein